MPVGRFDSIRALPDFLEIRRQLSASAARRIVTVEGTWGSAHSVAIGLLSDDLARPIVLVTAHTDAADDARDDIEAVAETSARLLPQRENATGDVDLDDELEAERLRITLELWERRENAAPASAAPPVIVAPIHALMQPVPAPEA